MIQLPGSLIITPVLLLFLLWRYATRNASGGQEGLLRRTRPLYTRLSRIEIVDSLLSPHATFRSEFLAISFQQLTGIAHEVAYFLQPFPLL